MSATAPAIERFTLWCRFSHGHEAMGQSQGEFVRYTDHRAALDAAEQREKALREAAQAYLDAAEAYRIPSEVLGGEAEAVALTVAFLEKRNKLRAALAATGGQP